MPPSVSMISASQFITTRPRCCRASRFRPRTPGAHRRSPDAWLEMIRQYAASCSQHRLLNAPLGATDESFARAQEVGRTSSTTKVLSPTRSVRNSARAGLPRNWSPRRGSEHRYQGYQGGCAAWFGKPRARRRVSVALPLHLSMNDAETFDDENSQSSCHRDGRRSSGTWFFSSAVVNGLSALGHPKVSIRRPIYLSMLLSWNEGRRPSSIQGTHETAEKSIGRRELQSIRIPIANFGKTQTTTSH